MVLILVMQKISSTKKIQIKVKTFLKYNKFFIYFYSSVCFVDEAWRLINSLVVRECRYYMAMGASKIVAEPLTITGSIGVVTGKFNLEELYRRVQYSKVVISKGK